MSNHDPDDVQAWVAELSTQDLKAYRISGNVTGLLSLYQNEVDATEWENVLLRDLVTILGDHWFGELSLSQLDGVMRLNMQAGLYMLSDESARAYLFSLLTPPQQARMADEFNGTKPLWVSKGLPAPYIALLIEALSHIPDTPHYQQRVRPRAITRIADAVRGNALQEANTETLVTIAELLGVNID